MDIAILKTLFQQAVIPEAWPRADGREFDEETFAIWALDAAREIQRRRGVTTTKDVSLTLVPGTAAYTLDSDVVQIKRVVPPGVAVDAVGGWSPSILDPVPRASFAGVFPTGQSNTLATDYAQRSAATRINRQPEQAWRFSGGKFVLDYVPAAGDVLKLIVEVEDAAITNVPDRYRESVLVYLRLCAIDSYVTKTAGRRVIMNENQNDMTTPSLRAVANDLRDRWELALSRISAEAK